MNDPIRKMKRLRTTTLISGVAVLFVSGIWSLQRIPDPTSLVLRLSPAHAAEPDRSDNSAQRSTEINQDAFLAVLWHDPSPVVEQEPRSQEALAPEPLHVQLVAIIEDNGRHQAALYDEREDRIIVVADGERLRDHDVHVTAGAVEFIRDGRSQHLLLHPNRTQARGDQS